jgi:two-component system, OmpR family, sensor kinase
VSLLRRLSIRARITLGSLLVGAVVLTGIALVLHVQIHDATLNTERTLAEADAAPFISDLRNNPDETPDRPSNGVLVSVRDEHGKDLVDTLPEDLRERLPGHRPAEDTMLRIRTNRTVYTVVGYRVVTEAGRFQVWAAHNGAGGELTVRAVDRSLVIGTVLALLAFGATAWLLTTLALRPVGRMRRTAEALAGSGARERSPGGSDAPAGDLPVGPSDDELAALARTLNTFLERQRESAAHERRMVSDASHELRTPLAALTGRLELAHRSFGDAAALQREILDAEASVARLTDLANTLLALSRVDDAAVSEHERTPVGALVTELMDAVARGRTVGRSSSVDVDFVLEVPHPDTIARMDVPAFGRIVDNLVANAIAFSPTGGDVAIAMRQGGGSLVLTVEDSGPGVPEAFLPHAFERFARADESRRRVRGGSGLGLALVAGLAERAGGSASLANRDTGGAVATVRIPTE